MIASKIRFINPMGFHSRPCATFSKMAKKFDCNVRLVNKEKEADGRSMLALMKLGIVHNSAITLLCEGEQEKEASEILSQYLSTLVEEAG
ncbi:HPr family phosphocarrier protein [Rahnella sp. Lac-M11]|jgi:phosphocarrier protein HPr|uniref:Phosphocarrier protein HPr n=1 Tax=Rahnella contaminans TaxID=2703882 RepID=A0A6M2AYS7_9GAMM|nr:MULTISPECIES: HPr family phosphocarrier protein [Rahnella]KAB8309106.1 HPr family phosphocarrier protein [Rouxiella chamberiensis]MBU9823124.1 HPr family phosphocarrier protein [Rahnella sp. BCC 1045]MCS3422590.1 phosphotransferase system HPr (HPr) family protein [Rahnella sp. BIGb0603]NGX86015.1 HPr family phosphocarrier protein [Rahnella contaminans]